jgi:hypothetical protein
MQQLYATDDEVVADLADLMHDNASDVSSESELCDDDGFGSDADVLCDANMRCDADGRCDADVRRGNGAVRNTANAKRNAGNATDTGEPQRPFDSERTARRCARRLRSAFPAWLSRRVRRRSVYIPGYDVNRIDQELCIHRELAPRRGADLEVDGLATVCSVDSGVNSLRNFSLLSRRCTAVLDIGVSKSVIGMTAAKRPHAAASRPLDLVRSHRRFLFGDQVSNSMGTFAMDIPTPGGVLELSVDVVDIDVPFLLGLDVMDKYRLQVLTVTNELELLRVA